MIVEFNLNIGGRIDQHWSIEVADDSTDEQILEHIQEEMAEALRDD
jgi:hypothetical protein